MSMTDSIVPSPEERLATGWEPDLSPADTLVRRAVLVHASWATAVAEALGRPAASYPPVGGRASSASAGRSPTPSSCTRPLRDEAEYVEVLAQVSRLVPVGVPYFLVSPFPTPDLSAHGVVLIGHPR